MHDWKEQGQDEDNAYDIEKDNCVFGTLVAVLKTCAMERDLHNGNQAHAQIVRQGLLEHTVVCNSLINMYTKCGALKRAQELFHELSTLSTVSWNVLIAGFVQSGHAEDALQCFKQMESAGFSPDAISYGCILKACGSIGASNKGQDIHLKMVKKGLLKTSVFAANALLDMYAKCDLLYEAEGVFNQLQVQDVVSWTTIIDAYAQHGHEDVALHYFERMCKEGCTPNAVTAVCVLKACTLKGASYKGQEVHAWSLKQGILANSIELGTALVDMYAKNGMLSKAATVLLDLPARNVVSWTALITGYAQQGFSETALLYFDQMQCENVFPNTVTFTCALKACSSLGIVYKAQQIHIDVVKEALLQENQDMSNALLDVYAKGGMLSEAQDVFDKLNIKDVACWNSLVACYAQLGKDKHMFKIVDMMISEGVEPDDITSVVVLNAYSHRGLVDEGQMYFLSMSSIPTSSHYNCLIDLFGSTGQLDKAVTMIIKMPFVVNPTVWRTMLGACNKLGYMSFGAWAFEHAAQSDDNDTASYVLLSNISASVAGCCEEDEH